MDGSQNMKLPSNIFFNLPHKRTKPVPHYFYTVTNNVTSFLCHKLKLGRIILSLEDLVKSL